MTYARLKAMDGDQLARWICARRGVYSSQERIALARVLAELQPGVK